jgi:pimeloyl-ACP methyl ester carboxylesterase
MSAMLATSLAVVTLLCAGTCRNVPSQGSHVSTETAVLVVPGYYGSRLSQVTDGSLVWISAMEALFGTRSLVLPLPGMRVEESVDLGTDGILRKVAVIPLLYSIDAYGSLLDALDRFSDGRVMIVPVAYDWRRDVMEAVRSLHSTVTHLRAQGVRRVGIVAHSMGGLVVSYYLRYGVQEVDDAVETWAGASQVETVALAGVPFLGTMTVFRNMQYGRRIGLNTSLLDHRAVSSFPASYYILPAGFTDVLLTPSLEPLKSLIRDAGSWKQYGWGLLNDPRGLSKEIVAHRFAYTAHWLQQSTRFSELLHAPLRVPNRSPIPLLTVVAKGRGTLAKGVSMEGQSSNMCSFLLFDETHFRQCLPGIDPNVSLEDGDGTVTVRSAQLPEAYEQAFRVMHREATVGHGELVSESEMQQAMIRFLRDAMAYRRAATS